MITLKIHTYSCSENEVSRVRTYKMMSWVAKNYENGHKNIFGLSVVLELKVKNLAHFYWTKYIRNQNYSNSMKKNQRDFWRRKMTLKVRILLFSTFNSKTTERPKKIIKPIFCKQLILVVNKWGQRTMKTDIKIFWAFQSF